MASKRRRTKPALAKISKRQVLNTRDGETQFCERCTVMIKIMSSPKEASAICERGFPHHYLSNLSASARTGCPFCFWLYLGNYQYWVTQERSQDRILIWALNADKQKKPLSELRRSDKIVATMDPDYLLYQVNSIFNIACASKAFDDAKELEAFLKLSQKPSLDFSSSSTMRRVKEVFDTCENTHSACMSHPASILPTRVLQVGTLQKPFLRLYTSQPGETGAYMTLSYCWGGSQEFTTTLDTLAQRSTAVPADDLPLTVQDAVLVTRHLGCPYLWVDALCILQDCEKDKHREIAHMGSIYKNSTLTIAATNAKNVKEGFLKNIPASTVFHLPHQLGDTFSAIQLSYKLQSPVRYHKNPLNGRAWALQEALLSPRVLSYGNTDITWRCQSEGLVKSLNGYGTCQPLPSGIFKNHPAKENESRESLVKRASLWNSIVQDYSGRGLSFTSDRMNAISGVASELSAYWKDVYIAGIWKTTAVQNLAWTWWQPYEWPFWSYCSLEDRPASVGARLRGPSWSWGSWSGQVSYARISVSQAELVDYQVHLLNSETPFLDVSEGTLHMRGIFLSLVQLNRVMPQWRRYYDEPGRKDSDERSKYLILGWSDNAVVGLILERLPEDGDRDTLRRIGLWVEYQYIPNFSPLRRMIRDEGLNKEGFTLV